MTKLYTITGQSRTKPEGLPSEFNVEETDEPFNRSIGASHDGDHFRVTVKDDGDVVELGYEYNGEAFTRGYLYVQREQVAKLRDALTEWLDDTEPQPAVDTAYVVGLLRVGRKIAAIKYYREATGTSLRDAKNAVEGIEAEAGPVVVTADSPEPNRAAVFEDVDGDRWRYGAAGDGGVGWHFAASSNTWHVVVRDFSGSFPWTRV